MSSGRLYRFLVFHADGVERVERGYRRLRPDGSWQPGTFSADEVSDELAAASAETRRILASVTRA